MYYGLTMFDFGNLTCRPDILSRNRWLRSIGDEGMRYVREMKATIDRCLGGSRCTEVLRFMLKGQADDGVADWIDASAVDHSLFRWDIGDAQVQKRAAEKVKSVLVAEIERILKRRQKGSDQSLTVEDWRDALGVFEDPYWDW